jgi:hypothetical protein
MARKTAGVKPEKPVNNPPDPDTFAGILNATREELTAVENLFSQTFAVAKKMNPQILIGAEDLEAFYRQNMWPLLDKMREIAGEETSSYEKAEGLHAQAFVLLGDAYMKAEHFKRAAGMYDTALALASTNASLADRCFKALSEAQKYFVQDSEDEQPFLSAETDQTPSESGVAEEDAPDETHEKKIIGGVTGWLILGSLFLVIFLLIMLLLLN